MPHVDAVLMRSPRFPMPAFGYPNTGHAINLEEPAAFDACVESVLSGVERGSWRRSYPQALGMSDRDVRDAHAETA